MKNGKRPGRDGTSVEFYKKFWHIIGDDFAMILTKFVNCRRGMDGKALNKHILLLFIKNLILLT